jgi:glucokinase
MKIYGFDIGGTSIKYSIFDRKFEVIGTGSFDNNNDGIEILDNIISILKQEKQIDAVGISSAGVIDFDNGLVLSSANIQNYAGVNVVEYIQKQVNVPIVIDNDVNCAAYAELKMGNLANVKNGLMLTVGTGIGGAIIINNDIYRGSNFAAGEIGHHYINDNTYEQNASTKNVLTKALDYDISSSFELLEADTEHKNKILDQMYADLGLGIHNLVTILDCTNVVIGGGIVQNENFDLNKIKEYAHFGQIKVVNPKLELAKAKYSNSAGSLGAALMAENKYLKNS